MYDLDFFAFSLDVLNILRQSKLRELYDLVYGLLVEYFIQLQMYVVSNRRHKGGCMYYGFQVVCMIGNKMKLRLKPLTKEQALRRANKQRKLIKMIDDLRNGL